MPKRVWSEAKRLQKIINFRSGVYKDNAKHIFGVIFRTQLKNTNNTLPFLALITDNLITSTLSVVYAH